MQKNGKMISLTRDEIIVDPTQGRVRVVEYNGDKESCAGLIPQLISDGARAEQKHNGAGHTIIATYSQVLDEAPIDRWSVVTEFAEKNLFSHPIVTADARTYNQAPEVFKEAIEAMVKSGARTNIGSIAPANFTANTKSLLYVLSRGQESYKQPTVVVRRQRVMSGRFVNANSTPRMTLDPDVVYSSIPLWSPNYVLFSLPDVPPSWDPDPTGIDNENVAQLQYGWKLRAQENDIVGLRAEQTLEFELGKWPMFITRFF